MSNNTLLVFFQKNRDKLYVLIFIFLFSVGGCKAESVELRAMSDASVATAHLITGTEISRRSQDRETNPLIGKPKQPEVRIEYEPVNNYTKEDVFDEIVEILKKDGWVSNTERSGYFTASLPQEYFTIMAEVLVHSKYNIVSVTFVTIPR
jgi:hypothetical protein